MYCKEGRKEGKIKESDADKNDLILDRSANLHSHLTHLEAKASAR